MEKLLATQYNIIQHQKVQTISARSLHVFLEVKTEFRKWITNCIKELSFRENVDFVLSTKKLSNSSHGNPFKDYALTLDTAKHIAICEPSLKGKQVREYFLKCEKKANSKIDYSNPKTLEDFLRHLRQQIKHNDNVVTTSGVKHA